MIRTCTKSKLVQSALIIFNDWASQEVNLFDGASTIEVEWAVGSIPIHDNIGKNIIIRYDTDIASASKYYTDANGREVLERIRDYRPTWNYTVVENISSNYYPINSRIWIKDQQRQFTVLTGMKIFINCSPNIFQLCKLSRIKGSKNKSRNMTPNSFFYGRLQ
jgi:lysosomal alpha-mannosidase